ncbi:MAG: right-handed parallel beta-helix repeat-containing protein [Pseudomonadota bacterium]
MAIKFGNGGDNKLTGTNGIDLLVGCRGDDTLEGKGGIDFLFGGRGEDVIYGGDDTDFLLGGKGNDVLYGGEGDDYLNGGRGHDEAFYEGASDDFTITYKFNKDGRVVGFRKVEDNEAGIDGDEGTDYLRSIEELNFGDGVTISLEGIQLIRANGDFGGFFDTLKAAVDASAAGDTIYMGENTFDSGGAQIVVNHNLTIIGEGQDESIVLADDNTGISGNSQGWILVNNGATLDVEGVAFDGNGFAVSQAFRVLGSGSFDDVSFNDIKVGSTDGTAIAVGGPTSNVDVSNGTFTNIGLNGILYFGSGVTGTVEDSEFVGDGAAETDRETGIEIGGGANVTINGNEFSDFVGSGTDVKSAGVYVTTTNGGGSSATVMDNEFENNTTGIQLGDEADDTSDLTVQSDNEFLGTGQALDVNGDATASGISDSTIDGEVEWTGGAADNTITGGSDNDSLTGNEGADILTGNGGADTFFFAAGDGGGTVAEADTITDFTDGVDMIGLIGLNDTDLTITDVGLDAVISVTIGGEILAVVTGAAGDIDASDFA